MILKLTCVLCWWFVHICKYMHTFIKVVLVPSCPCMCSLEAVHPDAYQAFQTSRDLDAVLSKAVSSTDGGCSSPTKKAALTIAASVMTPVLPMLVRFADSSEIWCHVFPLTHRYMFSKLYSVTSWSSVFTTMTVSNLKKELYSVLWFWSTVTVFSITTPNYCFSVMLHTVSFQLIFQEFYGLSCACILRLFLWKWGLCLCSCSLCQPTPPKLSWLGE